MLRSSIVIIAIVSLFVGCQSSPDAPEERDGGKNIFIPLPKVKYQNESKAERNELDTLLIPEALTDITNVLTGTTANDNTGDTMRRAMIKLNRNIFELSNSVTAALSGSAPFVTNQVVLTGDIRSIREEAPMTNIVLNGGNTRITIAGSSTPRALESILADEINLLSMFPAIDTNGAVDCSAEFQAAANLAQSRGVGLYAPAGTYLAKNIVLTNGIRIRGEFPTFQSFPNPFIMDNPLMQANAGTWINADGGWFLKGNNLRGLNIENIGVTNWGPRAFTFGTNNVEGASFSCFRNVIGIGHPTVNNSEAFFENYNFLFCRVDSVRTYNVNTGFRLVSQNNFIACGNSVFSDIYTFCYPKTAANGNTNKAGVEIITLEPDGGVTNYHTGLGVLTFIRPQVNSFNSSGGINFRIESHTNNLLNVQDVHMHDIDSEGPVAVGIWVNRVYSSSFSIAANANPVIALELGEVGYDNKVTSHAASAKVVNRGGLANPNTFYGVFAPSSEGVLRGVNYLQGTNLITGNFDLGKATLFNSGIGGYVTTNPPGGFTYYASYHPFGVYASQTSTNSWFLSTNSLFGNFITMGSGVQFSRDGNSYFNNSGGLGIGVFAPGAARTEIRHTTLAQLNLSYDDSNRTFLRSWSDGNFSLAPSGGMATNQGTFRSTVFATGTGGYTSENIDGTGTASYHPGGILVPATSAAAYVLATNTVIGPTMNASGNGWGLNAASAGWNTNGFSVGKQGAPLFAQLESRTTSGAQMSLSYDDSNRTLFTTSSGGNLTVVPSGGFANVAGIIRQSGTNVQNEIRFIEADGSPTITNPYEVVVPSGSLATNGGGGLTLTFGGGGGSGDVTAAANLDDEAVVVGDGGVKGVQTTPVLINPSTGAITTPGGISTGAGGSDAGVVELGEGSAPSLVADTFSIYAGANVAAGGLAYVLPTSAATGFMLATDSSGVMTISHVGFSGSGNVARVDSPTFTGTVTVPDNSFALGTKTTGNYAAGTAEAGDALTGDSATSFFASGTLEDARLPSSMASKAFTGTLTLPTGNDPDVSSAGHFAWDQNGNYGRAYDGTRQVAVARAYEPIHVTVILPNDLSDASRDAFHFWENETTMNFVVLSWSGLSDTDDTSLAIEETDADGVSNAATVDAVEIATGSGPYTGSDSTISAATIEPGHRLRLDFDDTDTPGQVKITIRGYFDADVN